MENKFRRNEEPLDARNYSVLPQGVLDTAKRTLVSLKKAACDVPVAVFLALNLSACGGSLDETQGIVNPRPEILYNHVRKTVFDIIPRQEKWFTQIAEGRYLYNPAGFPVDTEALEKTYSGMEALSGRKATFSIDGSFYQYTLTQRRLPTVLSLLSEEMNYRFEIPQTKAQTSFKQVDGTTYASSVVELSRQPLRGLNNYLRVLVEICQSTLKAVDQKGKYFNEYPANSNEYRTGKLAQEAACNGLGLAFLGRLGLLEHGNLIDGLGSKPVYPIYYEGTGTTHYIELWIPDKDLYERLPRHDFFPNSQ